MARGTRADAEVKYAKAQVRAREVAQVMNEVEAEARRVDEKTARLKAQRMARDAQQAVDDVAAAEAKAAAGPKKKKPKAK